MEELKKAVFALVAGVVSVWTYLVPDAPGFASPEFARIFFWHFPCPMMLLGLIFSAVFFSFRYLAGPDEKLARRAETISVQPIKKFLIAFSGVSTTNKELWDLRSIAAIELGLVFHLLTMLSGILFSKIQWGAWWNWDPRQTSFLISAFFYGAYFAIRAAFPDPEKRAANSAGYLLATLLPQLFLILVYPRIMESLHPSDTIMKGQLRGGYLYVTLSMLTVVGILTVWLYRLRVRAGILLLQKIHGSLEVSRRPTGPSVVARPVPLSPEGGENR